MSHWWQQDPYLHQWFGSKGTLRMICSVVYWWAISIICLYPAAAEHLCQHSCLWKLQLLFLVFAFYQLAWRRRLPILLSAFRICPLLLSSLACSAPVSAICFPQPIHQKRERGQTKNLPLLPGSKFQSKRRARPQGGLSDWSPASLPALHWESSAITTNAPVCISPQNGGATAPRPSREAASCVIRQAPCLAVRHLSTCYSPYSSHIPPPPLSRPLARHCQSSVIAPDSPPKFAWLFPRKKSDKTRGKYDTFREKSGEKLQIFP